MNGLAIADAVAALLEPDATSRADVQNAEPVSLEADTFYLWLADEVFGSEDTGESDRHVFVLGIAWMTAADGETDDRDRATSEAIDTRVAAILALVRRNRANTPYHEWLQVDSVDYDSVGTHEDRGFEMKISGYIYDAS